MTGAFRIGSIKERKVGESQVRRLLKQIRDDDTINAVYFYNVEFSPRIIESMQKLFVRDGRRFSIIKLLSCSGSLSCVVSMILDYSSTSALALSNVQSETIQTINEALRTNQSLKILRISGATFLEDGLNGLVYNCTLRELDLCGSHISTTAIGHMSKSISKNSGLRILKLVGCDLEDHGMAQLIQCLLDHSTISELDLSNNDASSEALKMVAALIQRNRIEKLSLNSMKLSDVPDPTYLFQAIQCIQENTSLKYLDICGNHLTDDMIYALVKCLCKNSTLKTLDVSGCHVTESGIKIFGRYLSDLKGLSILDLSDNEITEEAAISLTNGLENNFVLKSLGPIEESYECSRIMQHFLDLNLAGRRALQKNVSHSIWPLLLAKTSQADLSCGRNENALFALLRGSALFER